MGLGPAVVGDGTGCSGGAVEELGGGTEGEGLPLTVLPLEEPASAMRVDARSVSRSIWAGLPSGPTLSRLRINLA